MGRLSESEIGSAMGAGVGSETVAIVYFEPLLHLDSLLLVNLEFLLASLCCCISTTSLISPLTPLMAVLTFSSARSRYAYDTTADVADANDDDDEDVSQYSVYSSLLFTSMGKYIFEFLSHA